VRKVNVNRYEIDADFIPLYEIGLVAGRTFSPEVAGDAEEALLLNEAAARLLGFENAGEAVGRPFSQFGRTGRIIGVVQDFNYQSLHQPVAPLTLTLYDGRFRYFSLRIETEGLGRTLADLEQTWQRLAPHRPFDYAFLDQAFAAQYHGEQRFGRLVGLFALLALFIACLGLSGLAAFTAERRTKEIGVRKVLGASTAQILLLLVRDVVRLVAVAFALSAPLTALVLDRWLGAFAFRTDLSWGLFGAAGALALLIALASVSHLSIRAARANPAESLRYE
jgi:putative ABC transport system permease protein